MYKGEGGVTIDFFQSRSWEDHLSRDDGKTEECQNMH